MKHISEFINNQFFEALKINSKSKVNTDSGLRDLSDIKYISLHELSYKSPTEESRDWDKAEMYFKKKSKPERLVNSIKDRNKLIRRWFIYVALGWDEATKVFKDEIIKREYYDEDTLDKYVLQRYNMIGNPSTPIAKERTENYQKYLEINNVKYQ